MIKMLCKCDRCGKEREIDAKEYFEAVHSRTKVGYTIYSGKFKGCDSRTIDVCEDCLAEFKKWMEGENDAERMCDS